MILMIDNYDSFTYNVVQYLQELGEQVYTVRNDEVDYQFIEEKLKPRCIVISPGPKSPIEAGQCLEVIDRYKGIIPILGVCLGHQCIGHAFGGDIVKAKHLMHGKNSPIKSLNKGIFENFPKDIFTVTRYHSLVIKPESLPACLEVTCESEEGEIMGVRHKDYLIEGIQFHPEAVQSEYGLEMFKRFLDKCPQTISDYTTTIKDTRTNSDELQPIDKTINFQQDIFTYDFEGEFYDVFQNLYYTPKTDCCSFFDSASGPRKDANISTIGLGKLFALKIKNEQLIISAENTQYIELLNEVLEKHFSLVCPNTYNMHGRKFSEVFQLLRYALKISKLSNTSTPLSFPLIGYFGYEYIHYLENIPLVDADPLDLPEMELHFYSNLLIHDIAAAKVFSIHNHIPNENAIFSEGEIKNALSEKIKKEAKYTSTDETDTNIYAKTIQGTKTISKEDYLNIIQKNKDYVVNGDIFQVQISVREKIEQYAKPLDIYSELRKINPSPYMCFFKTKVFELVCNSPELQFSIKNKTAMIRPIAGTSPGKGTDEASRNAILDKFAHDAKENAEHLMLVDLARNDLSRMAKTGSVKVDELMTIEEYANVFHLTSTVTGELRDGLNPFELFEDTFPAGTLTGAPKIRAMEIIAEHEPEKRNLYGGAIGVFDLDLGDIMSTIVIRSVLCKDQALYLQAAAGTVADSIPEREWNEIDHKLSTLRKALAKVIGED